MAKERNGAASLFQSMGKNRDSKTEIVNSDNESMEGIVPSQQNEKADNPAKTSIARSEESESDEKEEYIMTHPVDSNEAEGEYTDKITEDIEYEGEKDDADNRYEEKQTENKPKRRGRRPSNQDIELQHIHIALPPDVYEKLEIGKKAYYNNKTTYIRNLIINDYEKNREVYEKLPTIR